MSFHTNSHEIINHLRDTIGDLADKIDLVIHARQMSNPNVNGWKIMALSLFNIGMYFSAIDGDISDDEAGFLADVNQFMKISPVDTSHWTKSQHQTMLRSLYKDNPDSYRTPDMPQTMGFLEAYDQVRGTDYVESARAMYFRYANAIVKADGKLTQTEEDALFKFKNVLYGAGSTQSDISGESAGTTAKIASSSEEVPQSLDELLNELNTLIGLERVKGDVSQLVNFLKVQQIRKSKGLGVQPVSRHLVFYGNPGTGKTTIARLLAQIYKSLGILSKGHAVETDRSGLVAGYVGQTALKTTEVVESALGGILFIDEAYALNAGNGQDFGQEAIDTLLKAMEDKRDDFIVIAAGYTDKMSAFLSSNPGLRSRFNKYLSFEDYSPTQLVEIFDLFCENADYHMEQSARDTLLQLFATFYETRDETFGNARLARNLFEMTLSNQANRIVTITDITEENLSAITEADLPTMTDLQSIQ